MTMVTNCSFQMAKEITGRYFRVQFPIKISCLGFFFNLNYLDCHYTLWAVQCFGLYFVLQN